MLFEYIFKGTAARYNACAENAGVVSELRQHYFGVLIDQIERIAAHRHPDGLQEIVAGFGKHAAYYHRFGIEYVYKACKPTAKFTTDIFDEFEAQQIFAFDGIEDVVERNAAIGAVLFGNDRVGTRVETLAQLAVQGAARGFSLEASFFAAVAYHLVVVGNHMAELAGETRLARINLAIEYYAYSYALPALEQILAENPSIEVVIDLHRDAAEGNHYVTEVNGKQTAQIMFFNGVSRSTDGPIDYLENPYVAENLAFSFQLKMASDALYPGLTRRNYLRSYRYNLHMRPKSVLIEVGAETNTLEEEMNAIELLAEILAEVLQG